MKLGVMLNDPEEEHDCFSDNTHNSHYYDGLGIQNVYNGRYVRVDGSDRRGRVACRTSWPRRTRASTPSCGRTRPHGACDSASSRPPPRPGMAYDQMLARGNAEGEALIMGGGRRPGRRRPARSSGRSARSGWTTIGFEGSDSLDDPERRLPVTEQSGGQTPRDGSRPDQSVVTKPRYRLRQTRRARKGQAMIVCHCMEITDRDIGAAVDWMRASDPRHIITPGKVYRALGKKADCGGCHAALHVDMRSNVRYFEVPCQPAELARKVQPESIQGKGHEGRREGH